MKVTVYQDHIIYLYYDFNLRTTELNGMSKDAEPYMSKLRQRRYDELAKEVYLSDEFLRSDYEPLMKYVLECMQPIPERYSERLYHTCQRIVDKLERDLAESGFSVDFRYQGPRQIRTEVALYGDIEMMVILPPQETGTEDVALRQLGFLLKEQCGASSMFKTVDDGCSAALQVSTMKKPKSTIAILPCSWIDTESYKDKNNEIARGIVEYDFQREVRKSYLPFRNIARINQQDDVVGGNLKRLSRMIRSLQLDADEPINLTSYELTCVLYNMPGKRLSTEPRYILSLLPAISDYLDQLARYGMFRKVMTPSKKELVFYEESKGEELAKLKSAVDDVVLDLQDELRPLGKDLTYGFPYE